MSIFYQPSNKKWTLHKVSLSNPLGFPCSPGPPEKVSRVLWIVPPRDRPGFAITGILDQSEMAACRLRIASPFGAATRIRHAHTEVQEYL